MYYDSYDAYLADLDRDWQGEEEAREAAEIERWERERENF